MCNHRVLNPGLPAVQSGIFDSAEDADDAIEDEHHAMLVLAMCMPDRFSRICSADPPTQRLALLRANPVVPWAGVAMPVKS